ncbi:MAG: 23S rRNA (adenine(2030)-N(6))-methyltransferase RlmJ [Sedimentisphaerales bacterium]|nr:23S rRNA (adenine(2030)-N(6))-methyltransferase RlmJ [Sedimentisphaerales bacterium]
MAEMRIIAGAKRGMKLLGPGTKSSRPITDMVKESLFDVLYNYDLPKDKVVADLFCGVGSLGLEALSRGADFVTFIERNSKTIETLRKNIAKAGLFEKSKVMKANVFKIGAPLHPDYGRYDLIFIDPPYAETDKGQRESAIGNLMDILLQQTSPESIVVIRTRGSRNLLPRYGEFEEFQRRQWGTMAVTFYRKISNDE